MTTVGNVGTGTGTAPVSNIPDSDARAVDDVAVVTQTGSKEVGQMNGNMFTTYCVIVYGTDPVTDTSTSPQSSPPLS